MNVSLNSRIDAVAGLLAGLHEGYRLTAKVVVSVFSVLGAVNFISPGPFSILCFEKVNCDLAVFVVQRFYRHASTIEKKEILA